MKRHEQWMLAAIVLLAIASFVGFTVIVGLVDDNRDLIAKNQALAESVSNAVDLECHYAKENRQLLAQVLTNLSHGSFLDAPSQARLQQEADAVQERVEELQC